jgi:predicted acyltransferase
VVTPAGRNRALDVMRGMTVALMIVVNTPGNPATTFAPLLHARWHGFTPTDLVFPTFMFVVGCALSITLPKYEDDGAFLRKVITRTAIIFLLGYLMYWFPFVHPTPAGWAFNPIGETRIFGVLQRIGLGYGLMAIIIRYGKARGALIFSVVALVGYWAIMSQWGDYTLTGNAELRLDRFLMSDAHLYHGEGIGFDPEGVLSTLPAIVNTIAGYFAGRFVLERGANYETVARLMMWGALSIAVALAWNPVFPINKKIWTSSFVLLTVGIDLMVLPVLVFLTDIRQPGRWTAPFEIFGRNTLVIYLVSELGVTLLLTFRIGEWSAYEAIFRGFFLPIGGGYLGSLLFALSWTATCWLVGYGLDRRGIYLRV